MRRIFLLLAIIHISLMSGAAVLKRSVTPNQIPDFAFPQTVSTQSEKTLEEALKSADDKRALRALLDYSLAQTRISSESATLVLAKIEFTQSRLVSSNAKSLALLIRATLLSQIYSADAYKYNARILPLTPLPSDPTLWSRDQFRKEVLGLCTEALTDTAALCNSSLSAWQSIVETDRQSLTYYPTLFDFVASKVMEILNSMSANQDLISASLLTPRNIFTHFVPVSAFQPATDFILSTYAHILNLHAESTPAEIFWDLQRIDYIRSHTYYNQREQADRQAEALMWQLYDTFKASPYCGLILENLNRFYSDLPLSSPALQKYYSILSDFIHTYPDWERIGCLKSIAQSFTTKESYAETPMTVEPGKPFEIKITSRNVKNVEVNLYALPAASYQTEYTSSENLRNLKPIHKSTVSFSKNVPFAATETIEMSVPKFGLYAVTVTFDGMESVSKNRRTTNLTRATSLAAGYLSGQDETLFMALDPLTGKPIDGAEASFTPSVPSQTKATPVMLGSTDRNGFIIPSAPSTGNVHFSKGADRYSSPIHIYIPSASQPQDVPCSNIITDLPIYHPGDSVKWAAVNYSIAGDRRTLSASQEFMVIMRDANRQPIDTMTAVSDSWGRISGAFHIPTGLLTGQYSLNIALAGQKKTSSHYFTVSDYKLPTFRILLDKVKQGVPKQGDITLTGQVITYSGIPMAGIEISANTSASEGFRWFASNFTQFSHLSAVTDSDGRFSITLPSTTLDFSPAPDGTFRTTISATSPSGESQETDVTYSRGTKYIITSSLPRNIDVTTPLNLSDYIRLVDSEGNHIPATVRYRLVSEADSSEADSGVISPDITWQAVPTGRYSLIYHSDTLPADTLTINGFIIYTPTSTVSPTPTEPIWSPSEPVSILKKGCDKSQVLVFAAEESTNALMIKSDGKKIFSKKWIALKKGANKLHLDLEPGLDRTSWDIIAVRKYRTSRCHFDLQTAASIKSITAETITFRDKITPGSREKWSFIFKNQDSCTTSCAAVMEMYAEAFDALRPHRWNTSFRQPYRGAVEYEFNIPSWLNRTITRGKSEQVHNCMGISEPTLLTYGMSFSPFGHQYRYRYAMKSAVTSEASTDSYLSAGSATGESVNFAMESKEEAVATDAGHDDTTSETAAEVTESRMGDLQLRQGEASTAFFLPNLTVGSDGLLNVEFDVPDFNTTWKFNAWAYDTSLASTTVGKTVLANKPIMVQPNLPRFLRDGDEINISSLVTNNTDSVTEISVITEFFNPLTSKTLLEKQFSISSLGSKESDTVTVRLVAPSDIQLLGFRIKASARGHSDGEQSLIPILPASVTVIDSRPFYIPADTLTFSMPLESSSYGDETHLQYCDNPIWLAVTSLPSLSAQKPATSSAATDALFSACMAKGLLHSYPSITEAIRTWSTSDSKDSILVSMLEKNTELKTFLLQATPWMRDAQSDTERMQRLAMLLDPNFINRAFSMARDRLMELQNPDGGLKWIESSATSSIWATARLLEVAGRLDQSGYLPSDHALTRLIESALKYYVAETEKSFRRTPQGDFCTFVTIIDRFPTYKPSTTANKIISTQVQRTVKDWKKQSVGQKALSAILLYNHGYKPLARTVLESLAQFAKVSPQSGMYWPSVADIYSGDMTELTVTCTCLDAYVKIAPHSTHITQIRQWLLLQKEARNWGNDTQTSTVIAAILNSSTHVPAAATNVKINIAGENFMPVGYEKYSGSFTSTITKPIASGDSLVITRENVSPAWGCVYRRRTLPIIDVKAQSVPSLSIDKEFYVQRDGEWMKTSEVNVGDKLRVDIIVHATRAIDYVTIADWRPSCLEPVSQLPETYFTEGVAVYRENKDSATNIFIPTLPKGTYRFSYETWVTHTGSFASAIATVQSQYAPQLTAHTAGFILKVN